MNNDLKLSMKIVSSDNIKMKLKDSDPIDMNINVGGKEVDPIFRNSPAYSITNADITYWNNKSNFSGNYNDLKNKPVIPTRTSQLTNDSGYITKAVSNLENYTLTSALANVAISGDYDDLLDKPTIPTDTSDLTNNAGFVTSDTTDLSNYTLSSDLAAVATSGSYNDLYNTPELANVAISGDYDDLLDKPTLAVVASTGDYDDLTNKPTIPTKTSELTNDSGFITNANIPSKTSDLQNDSGFIDKNVNDLTYYTLTSNLSSVATSGSYADLTNKPTIPVVDSSVSTSSTNAVENGAITNYVNSVVESGSNANGNYIKYMDGTMICCQRKSVSTAVATAEGNLFKSADIQLDNFPVEFYSVPTVNFTFTNNTWTLLGIGRGSTDSSTTTTNPGKVFIYRSSSTGTGFVTLYINVISIGRWKA